MRAGKAVREEEMSRSNPGSVQGRVTLLAAPDSLQIRVRDRVVRSPLGGWLQDILRRKDTRTEVSMDGMANGPSLRLVHQTMYARGGATGPRADRGFEPHRTHSMS